MNKRHQRFPTFQYYDELRRRLSDPHLSTERFQNGMCAFYFCATPKFQTGRRGEPRLATQIEVFSLQTDVPSSLPYSCYPASFPPQCRLNRGNCVSLAASSRPLNWSDGSRTVSVRVRASTCFIWIPTILGTTISPHLARRQSAALQVVRLAIEENLWNLRADSAAGAPQVMTGLR